MTLRALVVDDEPAARAGLAAMVRADADFADVAECGDRDTAVRAIRERRPDVVLLDIELSPGTGFDVIDAVGAAAMPQVVFVTAFDRFALRAFEAEAIDYVLKPVDPERLRTALARAKSRVTGAALADAARRLTHVTDMMRQGGTRPVAVTDGERTFVFEPGEIVRIDAADYYARVQARGRSLLVRETLDAFEARLPSPPFLRVHRSAIVNLRWVVELARESRHRSVVVLRDGSRIPVSEDRRRALERWLWAEG